MTSVIGCFLGFVAVSGMALAAGWVADRLSTRHEDGVGVAGGIGLLSVFLAPVFFYYTAFERAGLPVDQGLHPLMLAITWSIVGLAVAQTSKTQHRLNGAAALRLTVVYGVIAMLLLPAAVWFGEWGYAVLLAIVPLDLSTRFKAIKRRIILGKTTGVIGSPVET